MTQALTIDHEPPNARALDLVAFGEDPMAYRSACAQFPSGVAAISSVIDGEAVVLVASSFQVGISLDPPLVLFAVQHASSSWPKLRAQRRIGVSVLGEAHDRAARQLASKAGDRFAGIATTTIESGAHFVHGAPVWLECGIHSEVAAGDHDLVLLEVHAIGHAPDAEPLIWHGSTFRTLAPRASARRRIDRVANGGS